jgi:uncharacterized protein YndB with AHSA1/START domain
VTNPHDVVSVERLIAAPPEKIFDILANPHRHPDFDGSSSVKGATADSPDRLSVGAKFQMSMKLGVGYSMMNTVTEFEEDRRIAWSPKPSNGLGARWVNRIWRYELTPADGGTKVTETWDISREGTRVFLRVVAAGRVRQAMEKSLEKLDALVTAS